jgi:hypothetical protein
VISFRYHLVTIVAVFLALALGVLMGTTVVKQSVIDGLQNQVDRQSSTADQLRKLVSEQSAELRRWDAFGQVAQTLLVDGKLEGRTLVIVTTETVDLAELDGVREALRDSGADVAGVLVAKRRMRLADEGAKQDMADLLQLAPSLPAGDLTQQAAARLGTRLAEGPGLDPGTDILRNLRAAGFLADQSDPDGLDGIGGPGQGVVVLAGGKVAPVPAAKDFFMPLVTSLAQASRQVGAGEAEKNVGDFVALVREDAALDARVLTVDDVDSMPGRVALVLGLEQLFGPGLGTCGDFGVKPGACGLVPQPAGTTSP